MLIIEGEAQEEDKTSTQDELDGTQEFLSSQGSRRVTKNTMETSSMPTVFLLPTPSSSVIFSPSLPSSFSGSPAILAVTAYCLITPFVTFSNKKLFSSNAVGLPIFVSFLQQAVVVVVLLLLSHFFCLFFCSSACDVGYSHVSPSKIGDTSEGSFSSSSSASKNPADYSSSVTCSSLLRDYSTLHMGAFSRASLLFYLSSGILYVLSSLRSLLLCFLHSFICALGPLRFSWYVAGITLPSSLLFVAMITFANLCLNSVPVSSYQVARSTSVIFNVAFSVLVFHERVSLRCLAACLTVAGGFAIASCDPQTLTWGGGMMGCAASFFGASYMSLCKACLRTLQQRQPQNSLNKIEVATKESTGIEGTSSGKGLCDCQETRKVEVSSAVHISSNNDELVTSEEYERKYTIQEQKCRICRQLRSPNLEAILILHVSAISLVLFIPILYISGELESIWNKIGTTLEVYLDVVSSSLSYSSSFPSGVSYSMLYSYLSDAAYVGALIVISGVLAALIPFTTYTCLKHSTPLVCNMIGFCKTCAQTLGGVILFGDVITFQGLLGIALCIAGCFWFSHVRYCESQKYQSDLDRDCQSDSHGKTD